MRISGVLRWNASRIFLISSTKNLSTCQLKSQPIMTNFTAVINLPPDYDTLLDITNIKLKNVKSMHNGGKTK